MGLQERTPANMVKSVSPGLILALSVQMFSTASAPAVPSSAWTLETTSPPTPSLRWIFQNCPCKDSSAGLSCSSGWGPGTNIWETWPGCFTCLDLWSQSAAPRPPGCSSGQKLITHGLQIVVTWYSHSDTRSLMTTRCALPKPCQWQHPPCFLLCPANGVLLLTFALVISLSPYASGYQHTCAAIHIGMYRITGESDKNTWFQILVFVMGLYVPPLSSFLLVSHFILPFRFLSFFCLWVESLYVAQPGKNLLGIPGCLQICSPTALVSWVLGLIDSHLWL